MAAAIHHLEHRAENDRVEQQPEQTVSSRSKDGRVRAGGYPATGGSRWKIATDGNDGDVVQRRLGRRQCTHPCTQVFGIGMLCNEFQCCIEILTVADQVQYAVGGDHQAVSGLQTSVAA